MITCQVVTSDSETPIALAPAHRRNENQPISPGCYLAIVNRKHRGRPRTFRVTTTYQSWILWQEEIPPQGNSTVISMKWVGGQSIN